MSITVKQRFIHMAPRKLRLVADAIRGKSADVAFVTLAGMPRVATKPVAHALKSAISAARSQNQEGDLRVMTIYIDEGPALKRRILRSRGRASRMEHRMSHLTLTLESQPLKKAKKNEKSE